MVWVVGYVGMLLGVWHGTVVVLCWRLRLLWVLFFGVLVMVVVVVCENWKVDASIFLFCAVFFVCVFFGHTVDALGMVSR